MSKSHKQYVIWENAKYFFNKKIVLAIWCKKIIPVEMESSIELSIMDT